MILVNLVFALPVSRTTLLIDIGQFLNRYCNISLSVHHLVPVPLINSSAVKLPIHHQTSGRPTVVFSFIFSPHLSPNVWCTPPSRSYMLENCTHRNRADMPTVCASPHCQNANHLKASIFNGFLNMRTHTKMTHYLSLSFWHWHGPSRTISNEETWPRCPPPLPPLLHKKSATIKRAWRQSQWWLWLLLSSIITTIAPCRRVKI